MTMRPLKEFWGDWWIRCLADHGHAGILAKAHSERFAAAEQMHIARRSGKLDCAINTFRQSYTDNYWVKLAATMDVIEKARKQLMKKRRQGKPTPIGVESIVLDGSKQERLGLARNVALTPWFRGERPVFFEREIPKASGGVRHVMCYPRLEDQARLRLISLALKTWEGTPHPGAICAPGQGWSAVPDRVRRAWERYPGGASVARFDIRNFFGSIDHMWLARTLPLPKHVIRDWVCKGYSSIGTSNRHIPLDLRFGAVGGQRGIPQGSSTSAAVAMIVTNRICQALADRLPGHVVMGYVDDFLIFGPFGQGREVLAIAEGMLACLPVGPFMCHRTTVGFENSGTEIEFVGYVLEAGATGLRLSRSDCALNRIDDRMEEFEGLLDLPLGRAAIQAVTKRLNDRLAGWKNSLAADPEAFAVLADWEHCLKNRIQKDT